VVRAAIARLFPAGRRHIENMNYGSEWQKQWLRTRRVAHPEILKLYLERVVGERLAAFALAERAYEVMSDEEALNQFLSALDGDELRDVVEALEVYEDEFPVSSVGPAGTVLLNQLNRVTPRPGGFITLSPDLIVGRVVLRLLSRIADPSEVEDTVKRMLPKVATLSDRLELLTLVGYRENAGHKLISEEAATKLEEELRGQIQAADGTTLAGEHDLLRVLLWAKQGGDLPETVLRALQQPEVAARLLKASVTESQSRPLDSRAVTTRQEMHWDVLVEVAGGEAAVKEMGDVLDTPDDDPDLEEAVALARKYLGGWRPSRHED
jgi:hypothetical protein